jgi:hypothetical protein
MGELLSKKDEIQTKQKLTRTLDRAMNSKTDFFHNRRRADPLARELIDSLGAFKDLDYLSSNFFPVQYIYFDQILTQDQIRSFLSTFKMENIPADEKFYYKSEFRKLTLDLINPEALIRLHICQKYSCNTIPGYLSIPYNFKDIKELLEYYNQNKDELYRVRKNYLEENKSIQMLKSVLINNFNISNIEFLNKEYEGKTNLKIAQEFNLSLKRLNKILTTMKSTGKLKIFQNKIKINLNSNKNDISEDQINFMYPLPEEKVICDFFKFAK